MPPAAALGVVDVVDTLERVYGLSGVTEGVEFKILCVNPAHVESRPSCSVNTRTGYWHCFSCGVGGDLAELGCTVLRLPRPEVLDLLKPASVEGMLHSIRHKLAAIRPVRVRTEPVRPVGGPYDPGPLTSLRSRGFTTEVLRRWDVQFCPEETLEGNKGPFTIKSSIAIPIKNQAHNTLAWCYRRTDSSEGWQPRYLYDREVSHLWFGMQHHADVPEVCIVEGALDTIWMDQHGFPALGLLGAGMASGKKKTLHNKVLRLQRYKSLILLGDRDKGGELWVRSVGETLGTRMPVWVGLYNSWMPGNDPQDLDGVDLEIIMSRLVPWTKFHMRSKRPSA